MLRGESASHKRALALGVAVMAVLGRSSAFAQTEVASTYTDGHGTMLWSDANNWSPTVVPENTVNTIYDVTVPSLPVTLDVNPTVINSLTIQTGGALGLVNDSSVSLTVPTVELDGNINIGGNNTGSSLSFATATTLNGAGNINLTTSKTAYGTVATGTNGSLTISASNTIDGAGGINASLQNNGTISANVTSQTLLANGSIFNSGLVLATNGGTLQFGAGSLDNLSGTTLGKGGVYEADANSTIKFSGPIATNGAIIILGGANASIPALQSLTANNGELTLQNGGTFTSGGDLSNAGVVSIDPSSGLAVTGNYTQSTDITLVGGSLSAAGATGLTINGGTLQIGTGGASGVVSGNIIDNSAVVLDRSDSTASFANNISGSGTVTMAGTGTVALSGSNSYGGLTFVKSGTLAIGAAAGLPAGAVVINSATFSVQAGTAATPVVSGEILGGGTLTVGTGTTPAYLQLQAGSGTSSQSALTINSVSTLDITNNILTINYTPGSDPAATIRGYLQTGYSNDKWTGRGIVSSNAAANPALYAVGYSDGSTDTGGPAAANQIYIVNTLAGDANLDGVVNFPDLLVVAQNFGKTGEDWAKGDFNYDGVVNFPDLLLIAQNFGKKLSAGQLAQLPGSFTAEWQLAETEINAVPEPTMASVLALVGAGMLLRRRRESLSALAAGI